MITNLAVHTAVDFIVFGSKNTSGRTGQRASDSYQGSSPLAFLEFSFGKLKRPKADPETFSQAVIFCQPTT